MAWIESHTTLREHPKTKRLCRLLGINRREAIGLLHILWWWALDFAPEGDLSDLSDEDIADSIDWEGDAHVLLTALSEAGFLDADRHIHDWDEFAEKWIARRRANAERMRLARAGRKGGDSKGSQHVQSTFDARDAQNGKSVGLPDQPDQPTNQPVNPTQTLPLRGKGSEADAEGVSRDVVERLAGLPDDLTAKEFHQAAEEALTDLGFDCSREVKVADRGDGHAGRLDLVAERGDERIAFEFDDRSPRLKSLKKLACVAGMFRVVVLRCPFGGALPSPPGVDLVIGAGRPLLEEPGVTPVTTRDREVWNLARAAAAEGLSNGNAEALGLLVPLGRAADGGLHLRAPPGLGLGKFTNHVVRALLDAGDEHAAQVAIVEGRPGESKG